MSTSDDPLARWWRRPASTHLPATKKDETNQHVALNNENNVAEDTDEAVTQHYIEKFGVVYPAVEGRITFVESNPTTPTSGPTTPTAAPSTTPSAGPRAATPVAALVVAVVAALRLL